MRISKQLLSTTAVFAVLALLLFNCRRDLDTNVPHYTKSEVNVLLTDSPGNYDAVFIDIQNVMIHSNNGGWVSLNPVNSGIYNLLDFSNGLDTLLGSAQLPSGIISQLRLVLGNSNGVMVDSIYYPLSVPGGSQSGLKLNLHDSLIAGITYNLWIDFDASRSVITTGNGQYKLKPVLRTFSDATTGAIKGVISPDSAAGNVMAIIGVDTTATTASNNGAFMINGLTNGSYVVYFQNANGYKDTTVTPVSVSNGAITDMGTIFMSK